MAGPSFRYEGHFRRLTTIRIQPNISRGIGDRFPFPIESFSGAYEWMIRASGAWSCCGGTGSSNDGNRETDFGLPVKTMVKGDSLSANIAAASILAKVTRDDIMIQLAQEYPEYGFEIHKGYGTKAHYAALAEHGPSAIHRRSFLKKFYGEK